MKKFTMITGLPRAGTTLLCQILNSNPQHHVTPTSGVLDMLKSMRSTFSQHPSFKAQDRIRVYNDFRNGLKGFLDGYFQGKDIVFDKSRAWIAHINLLDNIFKNHDSKIIFCYRDPVEVLSSIEAQHQRTMLLEIPDESSAPHAFLSLEQRISVYASDTGLVGYPMTALKDAIEMGYLPRILFVKYFDLTNHTQAVMNAIHQFIGEESYTYDLENIKQTTFEWDGTYNYKFIHQIKEGEIRWKKADVTLPIKYIEGINNRFMPLNKLIFQGDVAGFAGEEFANQQINMVHIPIQGNS